MTTRNTGWNVLKALLLAAVVAMLQAGCLPQGGANAVPVVISGSVGDGPVTGATVTVYAIDGSVLGTMTSDSAASFRSTLNISATQYPLRVVVSGGIDLVTGSAPDFEMVSVMLEPSDLPVNVNPFSTLVVLLAENMPGGLNRNTVNAALPVVLGELGFGLDTATVPDPISTAITASNVANLVKASEALGEMVRRTRNLIAATGQPSSGDTVMAALAADLVDGVLDGHGTHAADTVVAAVANVVSGQVLVEAMTNSLRVGGVIATNVIDQAILSTQAGAGSPQLSGEVQITGQMIQQAALALAAIKVLDSSQAVSDIAAAVAALDPGSSAASVKAVLPSNSSSTLNGAVTYVASASVTEQDSVNQVVASGGGTTVPPVPVNTPPVISGTPATTVTANSAYVFQPAASDADGDPLSFIISKQPPWASFNPATGRLSGTPTSANVGTYGGIVISVVAGGDTVSLASFSITVNPAPVQTGSLNLNWVAPSTRADGSPLSLADIAGYRVYYGTSPGTYPNMYAVTNGAATSVTINGLPVGTYYVVMSTYDAAGLESAKSAPVTKTVP